MRRMLLALLLLCAASAEAHRPSDAFLDLRAEGRHIDGHWEIALRDLPTLADLDANRDRALTWGELRSAQPLLSALLGSQLALRSGEAPCPLRVTDLLVNERSDGRYAWFAVQAECPTRIETLEVDYRLLFALDPTHRGILSLRAGTATHSAVLGPDSATRSFTLAMPSRWQAFRDYCVEGIWHIWIGYDHVLFLLALLLPSVLLRVNGAWHPQPRLQAALWSVFGIVTAFTLAHSVTLTLAALGLVRLPGVLVESAIAASVLLAALNNLVPLIDRARWMMALGFGLIHGFGFASVLGDMGLPKDAEMIALVAFNVGVEIGQLAIVAVAVPLAFALRATRFYRVGVRVFGSLAVMLLAAYWLAQRTDLLSV